MGSLCITLPRASRTAWEVKFSEGIRLMKCFWRFFSCTKQSDSVSLVAHMFEIDIKTDLLDDVEYGGVSLVEVG
jgi:hypothetical protein